VRRPEQDDHLNLPLVIFALLLCACASVPPSMARIGGGTFLLGCDVSNDGRCGDVEGDAPLHHVKLSSFAIDRVEVSRAAYAACVDAGRCHPPRCALAGAAELPVSCVTWQDASDYCTWRGARLPTEAEWERAADGGRGQPYPWGSAEPTCARANFSECGGAPLPVGGRTAGASAEVVLDLAGNVSEWVFDWYDADAYRRDSSARDPKGPAAGDLRVQRGGSFLAAPSPVHQTLHSAMRNTAAPDAVDRALGFRCARSLP
jgi:formylglycine-generating enzyme